jgi:hypothetical protein
MQGTFGKYFPPRQEVEPSIAQKRAAFLGSLLFGASIQIHHRLRKASASFEVTNHGMKLKRTAVFTEMFDLRADAASSPWSACGEEA